MIMITKKSPKIIRTDKWQLNPNAKQKVLFARTVEIYRRYSRYLVGIVFTHWPKLASKSSQELIPAVERLMHRTAKNPSIKYSQINRVFPKFPSYYRRAAIAFAVGQVSSFMTRYRDWQCGNSRHKRTVLSKRFVQIAFRFNSEAIVFEKLFGWKPKGGKKRSTLKQRFHGWLKSAIVNLTEEKWSELGGKTVTVIAAYTSKLAYDGSGLVKRDANNYALAKFSNSRRYNADLNASQNIAARGILKLTRRNDRKDSTSKCSGKSPRSWACLCDLWTPKSVSV